MYTTTIQLQLQYTHYTTPQLQLYHTTATSTTALHHTTSSSCGWGGQPGDHCNHCNHSKKHNHLSVHQWIRSAIRDSQQPTSPIGFLFWNFRHRLVRHYWYKEYALHFAKLENVTMAPELQPRTMMMTTMSASLGMMTSPARGMPYCQTAQTFLCAACEISPRVH